MAAVAAQPVFRLLGAKDLGVSDDYTKEKMPAVNVGLLDGQLAWRQHDGGHTDGPNWKYFIPWADKFLEHTPAGRRRPQSSDARHRLGLVCLLTVVRHRRTCALCAQTPAAPAASRPADRPAPRTDQNSLTAHAQLLEKARQGGIDVYFVGDSITRRWGATDYPELLANWRQNFFGWNAANFGWGADRTQNILWRLENGELDGVNPKVIVMLAGTNNIGSRSPAAPAKVADITRGLTAILDVCRQKAPQRDDHPDGDLSAQRQHGRHAGDRSGQRQPRAARRRPERSLPQRQRQARRQGRPAVRRHDERPDKLHPTLTGLPGVGRRSQADPHGTARPARLDRPGASADRRSERAAEVARSCVSLRADCCTCQAWQD